MTQSEYLLLVPAVLSVIGVFASLAGALHERITPIAAAEPEHETAPSAG